MEKSIISYAPVIIPTLNRYEHFKRCLESLEKCTGAEKADVYVALDYPPSDKYVNGWKLVDAYLKSKANNNRFKNLFVIRRERNYGIGKKDGNYESLLEEIKKVSDRYIFSEDDNVFAPNFLEYVNWGLQEFKDDKRILAICGFKRINCDGLRNNVYMYPRYNAWGVGMWFNKKDKLRKLADFELFKKVLKEESFFSAFTSRAYILASLVSMLGTQKILGDVLPNLLPKDEQWCIFPKVNKVINNGHDGSGLHGGSSSQYEYYSHLPLDTDLDFTPHIVTELYQPELEKNYRDTYLQYSRKMQIYGTVVFLIYKLTGRVLHRNKNGRWPLFWLKKVE